MPWRSRGFEARSRRILHKIGPPVAGSKRGLAAKGAKGAKMLMGSKAPCLVRQDDASHMLSAYAAQIQATKERRCVRFLLLENNAGQRRAEMAVMAGAHFQGQSGGLRLWSHLQ